jgi:hypothetical protein
MAAIRAALIRTTFAFGIDPPRSLDMAASMLVCR